MLFSKAAELEMLDDVEAIWARLTKILEPYGIEFLNYITVDEAGQNPFLLSNIAEIYGDQPPERDPFLSHCCESYAITLTGPAYLGDYAYLPDAAKAFITQARRTGFETGIGIPMRLKGSDRYGGFNLGTRLQRDVFEAQIVPRQEEFRLFCLIVHRRLEELVSLQSAPREDEFRSKLLAPDRIETGNLTAREQEVAYLVASGMSRKECARLCAISPNTVSDYIKSIYRKLGVNDRVKLARLFEGHPPT